jgi:uncharacterized membrane-anchored protein
MSFLRPSAAGIGQMLNKVPEVTLIFWIIKIMATTVGETGADFLNVRLNLGLSGTSLVMGALLLIALFAQVRTRRYVPWLYWLTVVFVSVVGTLITDNLTDNLGVSLFVTTTVFSAALATTFAAWYAIERTLSVHTIITRKRELFYWAAILFTFALGTAAGDLMAEKLKLGYGPSALIFGALIAATYAAYRFFGANAILAFWIAYVLTRPFGASCGDLLSQSAGDGGLGLGATMTSFIFLSVIVGLVAFLTLNGNRRAAQRATAEG